MQQLDIFQQMQRQAMEQRQRQIKHAQELVERARNAPPSFIGGTLLPLLLAICCVSSCVWCYDPEWHADLTTQADAAVDRGPIGRAFRAFQREFERRGWRLHDVTRVCVCLFFIHEGLSVYQLKSAQWEEASQPMWTPFGPMRRIPSWEKGDAADMVLLFSALATAFNLLPEVCAPIRHTAFCLRACILTTLFFSPPLQLGLFLLLVDVATDTLDLLARLTLSTLVGQPVAIDELTAKKLSLLGVMALVATHRYREERANLKQRAARAASSDKDAKPLVFTDEIQVPHLLLLIGRILMASIFFYAAGTELTRLLLPERLQDIDPDDPHNVIWPKLLEITLAIPFVFGLWTTGCARALAATLAVEALTLWQFWRVGPLPPRLHAREHFAVNVAVAGGLLLVQEVGGGKLSVDSLLKRD